MVGDPAGEGLIAVSDRQTIPPRKYIHVFGSAIAVTGLRLSFFSNGRFTGRSSKLVSDLKPDSIDFHGQIDSAGSKMKGTDSQQSTTVTPGRSAPPYEE